MVKTVTPVQKALILTTSADLNGSIKNSLKTFEYGGVDSISNGIEALRKMATNSYEIVVCHNKLQFISGWNLIKEMKTSEKIQNMPVLLMGDTPAPATDDELKAYGLVKYLKSPPSDAELRFLINSTMQLFKTSGTTENKFSKAKAALIAKQSDQAVELYSELQGLTKKGVRSSLGLAEAYVQKGDLEQAERILMETGNLDEGNSSAMLMKIKIFINRKLYAEAQSAGLAAIKPSVQSPFIHSRILGLYAQEKVLEQAEHICRDAIQKNFRLPEFHNALCRITFAQGKVEDTLKVVDETIRLFGPNTEIMIIKGASLRKINRLDDALTVYSETLKISPMDPRVYFNMAVCCIAKKSLKEAKNHLEMCVKIKPDFPNAQAKLEEVRKYLGSAA